MVEGLLAEFLYDFELARLAAGSNSQAAVYRPILLVRYERFTDRALRLFRVLEGIAQFSLQAERLA